MPIESNFDATMEVGDEVGKRVLDDIKDAFEVAKVWDPIISLPSRHFAENVDGNYSVSVASSNETVESIVNVDMIRLVRECLLTTLS